MGNLTDIPGSWLPKIACCLGLLSLVQGDGTSTKREAWYPDVLKEIVGGLIDPSDPRTEEILAKYEARESYSVPHDVFYFSHLIYLMLLAYGITPPQEGVTETYLKAFRESGDAPESLGEIWSAKHVVLEGSAPLEEFVIWWLALEECKSREYWPPEWKQRGIDQDRVQLNRIYRKAQRRPRKKGGERLRWMRKHMERAAASREDFENGLTGLKSIDVRDPLEAAFLGALYLIRLASMNGPYHPVVLLCGAPECPRYFLSYRDRRLRYCSSHATTRVGKREASRNRMQVLRERRKGDPDNRRRESEKRHARRKRQMMRQAMGT